MIISVAFILTPEDVNSLNSVEEWMWFRIAMYSAIVVFWVPICKWLTIGKIRNKELDENQRAHEGDDGDRPSWVPASSPAGDRRDSADEGGRFDKFRHWELPLR